MLTCNSIVTRAGTCCTANAMLSADCFQHTLGKSQASRECNCIYLHTKQPSFSYEHFHIVLTHLLFSVQCLVELLFSAIGRMLQWHKRSRLVSLLSSPVAAQPLKHLNSRRLCVPLCRLWHSLCLSSLVCYLAPLPPTYSVTLSCRHFRFFCRCRVSSFFFSFHRFYTFVDSNDCR